MMRRRGKQEKRGIKENEKAKGRECEEEIMEEERRMSKR